MNKEQFLKELEDLLQDIDATEREEALNYYRDYLEVNMNKKLLRNLNHQRKLHKQLKKG